MKSSTLIVSYLWKDTWKRWCEQPGSPLARLFVTALLVAVATVILVAFQLLERSLRDRLERFGLDTLLVRASVSPDSPAFFRQGDGPDPLELLAADGRKLRLRQLFVRGQSELEENNLLVFSYPSEALPMLATMLSAQSSAVCLSDRLPKSALMRVQVGHRSLLAGVSRPQDWLRALSTEDILLVPQGWLPDEEQLGWVETTIFQRAPSAPPLDRIIAAVNELSALEQHTPPQIQSALPLMHELDELQARQLEWRSLLAGILGLAVALVYGAIAVLEFRQNQFVGALLRSFGAPAAMLYLKHWIENIFLVNLGALAAVMAVALSHQAIFGTFGLPGDAPIPTGGASPYASPVIVSIFLWINVGALLSSFPVAAGLRRPVGEILN